MIEGGRRTKGCEWDHAAANFYTTVLWDSMVPISGRVSEVDRASWEETPSVFEDELWPTPAFRLAAAAPHIRLMIAPTPRVGVEVDFNGEGPDDALDTDDADRLENPEELVLHDE